MKRTNPFTGMQSFTWIWLSQLLSIFGSTMTQFAFTIWAYQQTGKVTTLALMGFFNSGAFVLASPLAGVLADRWERKKVIALADSLAGLVTACLLILYTSGRIQIWHLYLAGIMTSIFGAFQEPAFGASIRLIVPENQLVRANGMLSVATDGSKMFGPMLAGVLLAVVGVRGILWIDLSTCLTAVLAILMVRIPRPAVSPEGQAVGKGFSREIRFGFRYIFSHPGLLGILLLFTTINLLAALTYFGVLPAMILARSGGDTQALGIVQSMLGIGGVVGGLLLSLWGGPKKRVSGFLIATSASFLLGDFLFASGRSLPVWIAAALLSAVFIPTIVSCYESIWQSHVAPDLQGRVFSIKNMIQTGGMPLGYLAGGLLADHLFEPAMAPGGPLAGSFSWLVGSGPGAGMGLMFACTCVLGVLTGLAGFLIPAVRKLENQPAGEPVCVPQPAILPAMENLP